MGQRKYFKHKITELEEIYSKSNNDFAILEELEEELSKHRSTSRAKKLLIGVQKSLDSSNEKKITTSSPPKIKKKTSVNNQNQTIDWNKTLANNLLNNDENNIHHEKVLNNHPENILDTWTVLEALSPQSYKKPNDLVFGTGSLAYLRRGQDEPWIKGEKSRPNNNLYYLLYLGAVDLEKSTKKLLEIFKDKRVERSQIKGLASLGVVLLDKQGIPLPETGLALSSFGWSYARVLNNNLDQLKFWESAENILKDGLENIIYPQDENGDVLPFSFEKAKEVYHWLLRNCNIPEEDTCTPSFTIRLYQPFSKGEPDPPLLNSFFLDDLQRAKHSIKANSQGDALSEYLGMKKPIHEFDILEDKNHIEKALQAKYTPLGRWPSNGRHSLVLLQQTAINLAMQKLEDGAGVFSVNGPPGTGKTTLLRDVVASALVKRAKALYQFKNTDNAFKHAGKMKLGNSFAHFYELDDSIRGHEILVASSNNKAVENVSKELPLDSQIAEDIDGLNYFKTVSDSLNEDQSQTWGLIASVMGNSYNRSNFINKAWWDDDSGLRKYFLSITGQVDFELDDDGEEIIPKIIEECDPPENLDEAKIRWEEARCNFSKALKASERINKISQQAYEMQVSIYDLEERIEQIDKNMFKKNESLNSMIIDKDRLSVNLKDKKEILETANLLLQTSLQNKPWIFTMIFMRNKWKEWKNKHTKLTEDSKSAANLFESINIKYQALSQDCKKIKDLLLSFNNKRNTFTLKIKSLKDELNKSSKVCGDKLVTKELWKLSHQEQQNFTPTYTDEAQRIRDDVFIEAIKLHKAFIDVSTKKIRQNLGIFFYCLKGGSLSSEKEALLPHLWSSMFLLTPVISTAFASVGNMLKTMPNESIGWLLIDEAGQATPQAAIGAILRAKRIISVGDPLQIEPIVSMPPSLVEGISKFLGVDPDQWTAPNSSVQTISDKANTYGTTIPRDLSEIRIGTPLLVHRRCENPMFTISNKLAYNNLMVHATIPNKSIISEIFEAQYSWFDVSGRAEEKWCPEEGDFVSKMLLKLFEILGNDSDIFVIAPFRQVAFSMRQRMKQEAQLLKSYGVDSPTNWIENNIGTVHTFQGKEAKAVILLLGAPIPSQTGARNWATSNVNILNVAVSRAKQNFYVVGNKELWSKLGHMKLVNRHLTKISV